MSGANQASTAEVPDGPGASQAQQAVTQRRAALAMGDMSDLLLCGLRQDGRTLATARLSVKNACACKETSWPTSR